MKKIFIIIAVLCGIGFSAKAQSYQQSLGLTIGFMDGISYKGFFGDNLALQADASFNFRTAFSNGFHLNPNVVYQAGISATPLSWFAGGGIAIGNTKDGFLMGVNGIGGLEYTFDFPLVIGTDLRLGPAFELSDGVHGGFLVAWNLTARFILK